MTVRGLLALAFWLLTAAAQAHVTSTGLASIEATDSVVRYRLLLAPDDLSVDLAAALMQAAEGDAKVTGRLVQMMQQAVQLRAGAAPCRNEASSIARLAGPGRLRLEMTFSCVSAGAALTLAEDWRPLLGEHHRNIVSVRDGASSREYVLGPEQREARFDLVAPGGGWSGFLSLGIEHILTGLDHLLFLLVLLVNQQRLWSVVRIVTGFTLAHSLTLSLAAFGLVSLPDRIVEPAIALSIVWVALENLFFIGTEWRRTLVAFLFGLLHGLGFAGALTELQLTGTALAKALIGFNLGVELGQIACVIVVLPLIVWASRPPALARLPQAASVLVALIGAAWFVERTFFS